MQSLSAWHISLFSFINSSWLGFGLPCLWMNVGYSWFSEWSIFSVKLTLMALGQVQHWAMVNYFLLDVPFHLHYALQYRLWSPHYDSIHLFLHPRRWMYSVSFWKIKELNSQIQSKNHQIQIHLNSFRSHPFNSIAVYRKFFKLQNRISNCPQTVTLKLNSTLMAQANEPPVIYWHPACNTNMIS